MTSSVVSSCLFHAALIALLAGAAARTHMPQSKNTPISVSLVRTTPQRSAPLHRPQRTAHATPDALSAPASPAVAASQQPSGPSQELTSTQGNATGPLAEYLTGLRQLIESRKVYPAVSRRMRETGKVLVFMQVSQDGTLQGIQIKGASRYARLDQAALDTVSGVGRYKPIPADIARDRLSIEVPIEFTL